MQATKVTHIWDFERCEEPGCGRIACYHFFSEGDRFLYHVCMAHSNENQCPFEIHRHITSLSMRRQIRFRRRRIRR